MSNLPLAFAEALAGGLLLTAGITGKSVGELMSGAISSPSGSPAGSGAATGTSSASAVSGSVTMADLKNASDHLRLGWSSAQLADWLQVIGRESGGNPNAVNSGTTAAYGVGQFYSPIDGGKVEPRAPQLAANEQKYYQYGGNPNTLMGQLEAMANYIRDNYGDPAGALLSEQSRGSY